MAPSRSTGLPPGRHPCAQAPRAASAAPCAIICRLRRKLLRPRSAVVSPASRCASAAPAPSSSSSCSPIASSSGCAPRKASLRLRRALRRRRASKPPARAHCAHASPFYRTVKTILAGGFDQPPSARDRHRPRTPATAAAPLCPRCRSRCSTPTPLRVIVPLNPRRSAAMNPVPELGSASQAAAPVRHPRFARGP